jgi:putative acetyltransferase
MTRAQSENLTIKVDDLSGPQVQDLLRQHLEFCRSQSPPHSVHALDIDALRNRQGLVFWAAWQGATAAGCIALQELDAGHGEIKSMHTLRSMRGAGVARALVEHLLAEARVRGYVRLSLETGSMVGFAPARRLYESFGFVTCPPFGSYVEDPNSVFMTLELRPPGSTV